MGLPILLAAATDTLQAYEARMNAQHSTAPNLKAALGQARFITPAILAMFKGPTSPELRGTFRHTCRRLSAARTALFRRYPTQATPEPTTAPPSSTKNAAPVSHPQVEPTAEPTMCPDLLSLGDADLWPTPQARQGDRDRDDQVVPAADALQDPDVEHEDHDVDGHRENASPSATDAFPNLAHEHPGGPLADQCVQVWTRRWLPALGHVLNKASLASILRTFTREAITKSLKPTCTKLGIPQSAAKRTEMQQALVLHVVLLNAVINEIARPGALAPIVKAAIHAVDLVRHHLGLNNALGTDRIDNCLTIPADKLAELRACEPPAALLPRAQPAAPAPPLPAQPRTRAPGPIVTQLAAAKPTARPATGRVTAAEPGTTDGDTPARPAVAPAPPADAELNPDGGTAARPADQPARRQVPEENHMSGQKCAWLLPGPSHRNSVARVVMVRDTRTPGQTTVHFPLEKELFDVATAELRRVQPGDTWCEEEQDDKWYRKEGVWHTPADGSPRRIALVIAADSGSRTSIRFRHESTVLEVAAATLKAILPPPLSRTPVAPTPERTVSQQIQVQLLKAVQGLEHKQNMLAEELIRHERRAPNAGRTRWDVQPPEVNTRRSRSPDRPAENPSKRLRPAATRRRGVSWEDDARGRGGRRARSRSPPSRRRVRSSSPHPSRFSAGTPVWLTEHEEKGHRGHRQVAVETEPDLPSQADYHVRYVDPGDLRGRSFFVSPNGLSEHDPLATSDTSSAGPSNQQTDGDAAGDGPPHDLQTDGDEARDGPPHDLQTDGDDASDGPPHGETLTGQTVTDVPKTKKYRHATSRRAGQGSANRHAPIGNAPSYVDSLIGGRSQRRTLNRSAEQIREFSRLKDTVRLSIVMCEETAFQALATLVTDGKFNMRSHGYPRDQVALTLQPTSVMRHHQFAFQRAAIACMLYRDCLLQYARARWTEQYRELSYATKYTYETACRAYHELQTYRRLFPAEEAPVAPAPAVQTRAPTPGDDEADLLDIGDEAAAIADQEEPVDLGNYEEDTLFNRSEGEEDPPRPVGQNHLWDPEGG